MKSDEMFDVSLIANFRKEEFKQDGQVQRAWYTFVLHFLPCVNHDWMASLNPSKLKNTVSMHKYLTVSDEAFVLWVIKHKYAALEIEKNAGWPKKDNKAKSLGAHASKTHIVDYTYTYAAVDKARKNAESAKYWNDLFWTYVMSKQPEIFAKNDEEKAADVENENIELPGIDVEEQVENINDGVNPVEIAEC